MNKHQQQVDEWIQQYKIGYFKPPELMMRLTEEVGELAREINHRHGPKQKKSTEETQEMEEELGDVLFTICCIANS